MMKAEAMHTSFTVAGGEAMEGTDYDRMERAICWLCTAPKTAALVASEEPISVTADIFVA